jgi:hypothetical protein
MKEAISTVTAPDCRYTGKRQDYNEGVVAIMTDPQTEFGLMQYLCTLWRGTSRRGGMPDNSAST